LLITSADLTVSEDCLRRESLKMKPFLTIIGVFAFATFVWLSLTGNAEKCIALEEEAKLLLAEANYCETGADCRAIAFGCPFGCETLINSKESERVMATVGNYHSHCMMICPDDCPKHSSPLVCRQAVCRRS